MAYGIYGYVVNNKENMENKSDYEIQNQLEWKLRII